MNSKLTFLLGLALCSLLAPTALRAQFSIEVTVNGASNLSSLCGDIIGSPDFLWEVNVENTGWVTYPASGGCFTAVPNVQYTSPTYGCVSEVGSNTIEVCFQVYEDDGLFGCNTLATCLATICQDVPLPLGPSQDYTLAIPNGQQSGGTLDFTISYNGTPLDAPNNEICNAIDLGVLNLGGSLGDTDNSVYNNFCANSFGEPDPGSLGAGWYNSISVWFTFTTGPDPIPYADLIAISDPSGLGDGLGLQIALFTSSSNTCSGPWTMVDQQYNPNGDNELLAASCLDPNQLYFVLIDGVTDTPQQTFGYFGFGIEAENVVQAEDEPCDAISMGAIPDGGIVDDNINYSNECATSVGDPSVSSFVTQKTVWFSFEAPTTGHILIESFSVPTIDPIGLQLAVFSSSDGTCSGTFDEVASAYSNVLDHQNLEVSCLNPGQTYWLMIDGDNDNEGTFNFQISDAGEDTPVLDQVITLCFGETLPVGNSVYDATGVYSDTIILASGCDSIVNTTLTVLDELVFLSLIIDNASAPGAPDGAATVNVSGGLPPYDYLWSDGQTTQTASNLEGGTNYCVTVSDQNACEIDTCFEMPFYTPVAATITDAVLLCNGDADGELILTPSFGTPPYSYNWTGGGNMGAGTIMNDGDATSISGLSAGTYSVTVGDGITEVVLTAEITEPPVLEVGLVSLTDASCFGVCDGTVEVEAMGGVGGYTYSWIGQSGPARTDLCAGTYTVTVTDANACEAQFEIEIMQPDNLVPTIDVTGVSCFQGADGTATVTANIALDSILWSTGEHTPTITGLSGGNYTVTIWDVNGCSAVNFFNVPSPASALAVNLVELSPVSCPGDLDAQLEAQISGPGASIQYDWSNNANQSTIAAGAGTYSVTVTNEFGCTATDQILVEEAEALQLALDITNPTCLDTAGLGAIEVTQTTGGTGPYTYSLGGIDYVQSTNFADLEPGDYELYVQDALGCEAVVSAAVLPTPELEINLGEDQVLDLGESIELTAQVTNTTNPILFTWSLAEEFLICEDTTCQSVTITPTQSGLYSVIGVDPFTLCTGVGEVFINVRKERNIFFPNAFSPDFDGVNDYFVPYGADGVQQVSSMRIFDRYGGLMYEGRNFMPGDEPSGWDGTSRGQRQSTGVYTYLIEVLFLDGAVGVYKGDVVLIR